MILGVQRLITCKNFLCRKMLTVSSLQNGEVIEFYGELPLLELAALDLAFADVLKAHKLPINQPLLEAFSCSLSSEEINIEEAKGIKLCEFYQEYTELFSDTCKATLYLRFWMNNLRNQHIIPTMLSQIGSSYE